MDIAPAANTRQFAPRVCARNSRFSSLRCGTNKFRLRDDQHFARDLCAVIASLRTACNCASAVSGG